MTPGQRRPCEPRSIEGDVGDRELPHGGARRPCRTLREVPAHPDLVQLLPQPTLPEVPRCRGTGEFIRRFLIHVLPQGFHRIRHYGLLASGTRADNIAQARRLLDVPAAQPEPGDNSCDEAVEPKQLAHPCPCCGSRMIIIETLQRGASPHYRPAASTVMIRIDTS